jgi:hypothetical protein
MFGGTKQLIRVESSPGGAAVTTTPSTTDGTTPVALRLQRKQSYVLTFSLAGYTSQQVELKRSIRGGILALDIVTCCLSVVVDAITGGWYQLSPNPATVTLTRLGASLGPETITVTVGTKATSSGGVVQVDSSVPGVHVHAVPREVAERERAPAATD